MRRPITHLKQIAAAQEQCWPRILQHPVAPALRRVHLSLSLSVSALKQQSGRLKRSPVEHAMKGPLREQAMKMGWPLNMSRNLIKAQGTKFIIPPSFYNNILCNSLSCLLNESQPCSALGKQWPMAKMCIRDLIREVMGDCEVVQTQQECECTLYNKSLRTKAVIYCIYTTTNYNKNKSFG